MAECDRYIMKILTESTPLALWYGVIQEAQTSCHIRLKEDVESYLVFLLMRYTSQQNLTKEIMASKFLEGIHYPPKLRGLALQGVWRSMSTHFWPLSCSYCASSCEFKIFY